MDDQHRARFEAVYRGTYEQMLGYALRRCASAEDAADVVAETYMIAWRRVSELPDGEAARMWLYGVARKVLANHHRGERRRAAWHEAFVAEARRLQSVADRSPESEAVAEVIAQLSEADREVLILALWEDLDPGRIAEVLGCSRNAVRIRLYRARRRFARALSQEGAPGGRVTRPFIREEMQ
ncbi:RNA polymerase sigma factor [Nonomuraea guangzhouensis]|uniref:RNA polymerase sigma factor n=1 Tax=Nonomuraea guangzhouensis TaxID=1291555 RepID=A0ABW4GCR3_9ACTN|nr:RNA polymerase sigma factor [Nonomuraea guangzhouensis]